jgi:hypothetical protein
VKPTRDLFLSYLLTISRNGLAVFFLLTLSSVTGLAQQPSSPGELSDHSDNPTTTPESKRLFGIVPNYRTSPSLSDYEPLSPKEKFKLAAQDAFDRGTIVLSAAFAGEAQLTNSEPSFGQGAAGYGRYFATTYADFVIGDYMTEAIFPSVLRQDPRYFRKNKGSGLSRVGYAAGQIFWTHTDAGGTQFNYSEVLGNSTAVAVSTAYYPGSRDAADAISRLAIQLGVDAASNMLKEFWPDINRRFSRKHSHQN